MEFGRRRCPMKYRKLFWPTILVITLTTTALAVLSVRAKNRVLSRSSKSVEETLQTSNISKKVSNAEPIRRSSVTPRIEAELITIRPWGFYPKEIRRPAGPFFLAVDNRSGLRELDVRLSINIGGLEQTMPLPKRIRGWRNVLDLPPGEYKLTEVNHPTWTSKITIFQSRG
jgi:hypothetical protein